MVGSGSAFVARADSLDEFFILAFKVDHILIIEVYEAVDAILCPQNAKMVAFK